MTSSTSISVVLDPSLSVDVERPMRRLTWCHGAGSVIVKVRCDNGFSTHLLLFGTQVSVLFAFNARMNLTSESVLDEKSLSVIDLSEVTGLSPKEVEDVISSLITAPHVLLQRVRNPRDSFTSSGFHSPSPSSSAPSSPERLVRGTRLFLR